MTVREEAAGVDALSGRLKVHEKKIVKMHWTAAVQRRDAFRLSRGAAGMDLPPKANVSTLSCLAECFYAKESGRDFFYIHPKILEFWDEYMSIFWKRFWKRFTPEKLG